MTDVKELVGPKQTVEPDRPDIPTRLATPEELSHLYPKGNARSILRHLAGRVGAGFQRVVQGYKNVDERLNNLADWPAPRLEGKHRAKSIPDGEQPAKRNRIRHLADAYRSTAQNLKQLMKERDAIPTHRAALRLNGLPYTPASGILYDTELDTLGFFSLDGSGDVYGILRDPAKHQRVPSITIARVDFETNQYDVSNQVTISDEKNFNVVDIPFTTKEPTPSLLHVEIDSTGLLHLSAQREFLLLADDDTKISETAE